MRMAVDVASLSRGDQDRLSSIAMRKATSRGRLLGLVCLHACAFACAQRASTDPAPRVPADVTASLGSELDGDLDGVPDHVDLCPRTPGVSPDGCPPIDRDDDGHLGHQDRCPELAGAADDGCPIPDIDDDGVPDSEDRCLDTRESANGYLDGDGCPDVVPRDLESITGVIRGVDFELHKDILLARSLPVLDRVAAIMLKYPGTRFEISGHVDASSEPSYGRDPSQRRALAVKRYLVEQGVAEDRLYARGAGPDEPIDTNKTAAGRAKNRRIEITLLLSDDLITQNDERRRRGAPPFAR